MPFLASLLDPRRRAPALFGLLLALLVDLSISHSIISLAKANDLTNYSIRLDHITYLTGNLDSLTRAFQRKGFIVTPGKFVSTELATHFVHFSDGTSLELEGPNMSNPDDWRVQALEKYGDHISAIVFRTKDLARVEQQMRANGVRFGNTLHQEGWRAFGIEGAHPLDIVFVERDDARETVEPHPNDHRRIEWIVISANKEQEPLLRNVFSALELTMRHEGWFDYWMMADPTNRLNIRIGPPYKPAFKQSNGIYLEENGIVYAY